MLGHDTFAFDIDQSHVSKQAEPPHTKPTFRCRAVVLVACDPIQTTNKSPRVRPRNTPAMCRLSRLAPKAWWDLASPWDRCEDYEQEDRSVVVMGCCKGRLGEILFLGDEDIVGMVDVVGGVIPAVGDPLVLLATSGELACEAADVWVGDRVTGDGSAPGHVEQGGVEHLLEQGALAGGVPGQALE
ncbi:hypothetical protein SMC26_23080 [Actinomadura fulvescens]